MRLETSERVHCAIETLGFRRNEAARVLRQGRVSRTLGLSHRGHGEPFYFGITRGVEEAAREGWLP